MGLEPGYEGPSTSRDRFSALPGCELWLRRSSRDQIPKPPARPRRPAIVTRGPGLLIPGCASVHTFGMRFALDLVFLDGERRPLAVCRAGCRRGRLASHRGAAAVLEIPRQGGEFASPVT